MGAQPSERVAFLLWRAGLTPAPPMRFSPQKSKPKEEKKSFHTASIAWLAAAAAGVASGVPRSLSASIGRPTTLSFSPFGRTGGPLMR